MPIIVSKYLFGRRFSGMVFWPFIVIKYSGLRHDKVFMNHEKIHLRQQLELLVIPFYLWYVIEYCFRYMHYKNRSNAYSNISFEREAYANETNLNYFKERVFWNFLYYLKKNKH